MPRVKIKVCKMKNKVFIKGNRVCGNECPCFCKCFAVSALFNSVSSVCSLVK
jgi:hypothetical protein